MSTGKVPRIAERLGAVCVDKGLRLAVAESMTAGALSDLITSVSGASRYFLGGIVCYAPDLKAFVGVTADTIERFGIYSKEVAAGLAMGALNRFRADVAVGVTGLAEPDGVSPAPAAWVAVTFGGRIETRHVVCGRGTSRNEARRRVAEEALDLVLEVLGDGGEG